MIITVDWCRERAACWSDAQLCAELGEGVPLVDLLQREHLPAHDHIWVGVRALPRKDVVEFACRCAERSLPLYEAAFPGDLRPREAIAAARSGDGKRAAADAARAAGAAWAADAADAAARAAQVADLVELAKGVP